MKNQNYQIEVIKQDCDWKVYRLTAPNGGVWYFDVNMASLNGYDVPTETPDGVGGRGMEKYFPGLEGKKAYAYALGLAMREGKGEICFPVNHPLWDIVKDL